ncbi:thiol:disulfide interchange protein DsbA/DsbL [Pasteurella sp. PK-2025]|uniref:thiol:disulfide interchange protein DsbA/DsbL n=1 Tax=Pasteurella sp. PK-2025 TaxID=3413133 RepID=UPI003C74CCE7
MWRIGFVWLLLVISQATLAMNGTGTLSPKSDQGHHTLNSEPDFQEGKDYFSYQEPLSVRGEPHRILIQFFFDYDCRVCSYAQDILELYSQTHWDLVDVDIHPVATEDVHYSARVFYALKAIGAEDISSLLLFETAEKQRYTQLSHLNELREWLNQQGVNVEAFNQAYYSSLVNRQISDAEKLTEEYGVFTFPYVVIEGKYVLTASTLYSDDYSFAVLDFLVNKLIKEKQKE